MAWDRGSLGPGWLLLHEAEALPEPTSGGPLATTSGPPVYGAPWLSQGGPVPFGTVPGNTPISPPPPPPPSHVGSRGKPLLRRDPVADRRPGRNWEILVEIVNSLLMQGLIYEQPRGVWNISTTSGPCTGLTGTFPEQV